MSYCSPAKLERVERHLSRQRGAGVRSLVTSFGFSLALPATACGDDRLDEPAAKRRKLSNVSDKAKQPAQTTPPATKARSRERVEEKLVIEGGDIVQSTTKPRARRRFDPIGEEPVEVAPQPDTEDSFTKTAKKRGRPERVETVRKPSAVKVSKKPRNAKPTRQIKENVPEDTLNGQTIAEVVEDKSTRRPRRQAAASAMAKVTEGFIEEAAPIDKKRREPEPERVVKRGRKKAAPVVASLEVVAVSMDKQYEARRDVEHEGTDERPVKRNRAELATVSGLVEPVANESAEAGAEAIEDVGPTVIEGKTRKPVIGKPGSRTQVKEDAESKPPEVEKVSGRKKQRRNARVDAGSPLLEPCSTSHASGRRPLGETHANAVMRSTSPEKTSKPPAKHEDGVREYVSGPKSYETSPAKPHAGLAMPVKKRKAAKPFTDPALSHDSAAVTEDLSVKTKANRGDERHKHSHVVKVKGAAKPVVPDDKIELPEEPPVKELEDRQRLSKKKPSKITASKATSRAGQPPAEADDNVDWLFAGPGDGAKPSRSKNEKKHKVNAKALSSRSNMAIMQDMDLDELLGNIATFAGDQTTGRSQKSACRGL